MLLLALAGCGPSEDDGSEPSPSPTPSPTAPSPTETSPGSPEPDPTEPPASPTTPAEAQGDPQLRAVWVHLFDDTLKTPASIDRLVERVADANFNTIIAEVVRRHDAYYESEVLPRATDPALPQGFDPLAYLLEQAHARGLAVEAWVPTMPAHHAVYADQPAPQGWVWTEHGRDAPEADRWVTRFADGTWDDHLDPALPAVRQHVADVTAEIARNYDVDALHLDYIRYVEADTGYHPAVLARYREETGATGTPSAGDAQWSAWRRDQVIEMVRQVRDAIKEAEPDLPVTAAVIAAGEGPGAVGGFERTRPYARFHQDWVRMVEEGLLDGVYPMNYFDESLYADWFAQWIAFERTVAESTDAVIAGGQGAWLNRPEDSIDQLQRSADALDGAVLYSYQQTAQAAPLDVLFDRIPDELWTDRAPALHRRG